MRAIIVHGGAGAWRREEMDAALRGLQEAALAGYQRLLAGASAVDACEEAVRRLEDNPLFNAGTGSVLTLDKRCEMDAAIVKGSTLAAGAVAGVERVRNPISLARKVMEETDHVLLVGEGARRFADALGFADYNPVTSERERQWARLMEGVGREQPLHRPRLRRFLQEHPEYPRGTVGCVALDDAGELVAGASTGGVFLKLPGRVGDTPIIGAGVYASPFGGASATGLGEGIMKALLAFRVVESMRGGLAPLQAAQAGVDYVSATLGTEAGVIALAPDGRWGLAKNTTNMPVAVMADGMRGPEATIGES